jgi:hypothetical protein
MIVALLWACGHAGTFADGEVGGDKVSVDDAFFVVEDGVFDGDDRVTVELVGIEDACANQAAYLSDLRNVYGAPDSAAVWAAHMPDEFWSILLDLRVADSAAVAGTFVGRESTGSPGQAGQVDGDVTHYLKPLDEDYWSGQVDTAPYVSRWLTDGGELVVDEYDPDGTFAGRFSGGTRDYDGEDGGDIELGFRAERCPEVEAL